MGQATEVTSAAGHEDDAARGVSDTVGGGMMGAGGTAVDHGDPSEQQVPGEDLEEDRTGMAGMPPVPSAGTPDLVLPPHGRLRVLIVPRPIDDVDHLAASRGR